MRCRSALTVTPAALRKRMALLCVFLLNTVVHAQGLLHEGTHFLVGFIHPERAPGEPLGKDAYRIIVSSRFAANALVAGKRVSISPNTSAEVIVDSCDVALVIGDKPMSVSTRIFMQGNGEQTMHLPIHAWGKQYRPFSWWTDRYGLDTLHYASGKQLVIASEDNTIVDVQTAKGVKQFKLDAGEFTYISAALDTAHYRTSMSDPTGELIVASKPIGVISGHSKIAVLEHPDALPANGPYARPANRSRGTLMEAMIPVEHAGTTFVTVPFSYSPTRKRGLDQTDVGIGDDRGDVIRFIGTAPNTVLAYTDSSGFTIVDTLHEGEVYTARSVETIRQWHASQPVLCAQYGKSYARITSQATLPEDDPSTDAGLPMLVSVPSADQWPNDAMFTCPEDLINYVSVVCRTGHSSSVLLNGKRMNLATTPIETANGEFTIMRRMVSPGNHRITTTSSDATFMAVTYGNLDGLQLCNAYASSTGIAHASSCTDSIEILIDQNNDSATATFQVFPRTACTDVGIAMLYTTESANCEVRVVGNTAHIQRTLATDSAYSVITCTTRHGSIATRRISFDAATSVATLGLQHVALSAHPMPASGRLHVSWGEATPDCLKISDVYGHTHQFFVDGTSAVLDVTRFTPGLYMLSSSSASIPVMIVR